ncbi:SIS domain-containing protein [Nocardioides sp. YIM 152315]|uniref:D-sedoheptulose-7-phosphate isomerase n=1 Tax=Nocardioides sp. YIM 152315 TaxID=3031760 RepID=UPI0023DA71D5|nr:SIS domain-containing protein [Nocardioides sp. YIM 152315]MDF1605753.1 SIS domain-containing protein [Nocardioides sp. YIM 152315]
MADWMHAHVADHIGVATALLDLVPEVDRVGEELIAALAAGGTLWTMGNGGSAADAQHFTGEVVGHYKRDRRPLPAVTLSTDATVMTCIGNDYSFDDVFARQVEALARPGDVVCVFTTSGNSANVVAALVAARAKGARTLLFGGGTGGKCREYADLALVVPSSATPRIQEMHTLMMHVISEKIDAWAAEEDPI